MILGEKRILLDDPDTEYLEAGMEFRLTYQGTLLADTTRGAAFAARSNHKHEIRKARHPQLRRLWDIHPCLQRGREERPPVPAGKVRTVEFGAPRAENTLPRLAERYARFGYNFIPLVTLEMSLYCGLDVLFLRTDPPGSLFSAGDIDNRLKTLFDGLLVPRELSQAGKYSAPEDDEKPFFACLRMIR